MTRIVRTAKVSDKGQLVLPADIRKALKMRKATSIVLVSDGTRVYLEREDAVASAVEESFADFLKASEASLRNVWENDADAVWDDA